MICTKQKLEKIEAQLLITRNMTRRKPHKKRHELRFYFCQQCKAYHTTSKSKAKPEQKEFCRTLKSVYINGFKFDLLISNIYSQEDKIRYFKFEFGDSKKYQCSSMEKDCACMLLRVAKVKAGLCIGTVYYSRFIIQERSINNKQEMFAQTLFERSKNWALMEPGIVEKAVATEGSNNGHIPKITADDIGKLAFHDLKKLMRTTTEKLHAKAIGTDRRECRAILHMVHSRFAELKEKVTTAQKSA